jgi:hypothetical protein
MLDNRSPCGPTGVNAVGFSRRGSSDALYALCSLGPLGFICFAADMVVSKSWK